MIHYLLDLKCVLKCTGILRKKREHDTKIQDEKCGNIIGPKKKIENTDINDTEVMHQNNIINDDIIDNPT